MNDQLSYQTTRMFHTGDACPKKAQEPSVWLRMKGIRQPRLSHLSTLARLVISPASNVADTTPPEKTNASLDNHQP